MFIYDSTLAATLGVRDFYLNSAQRSGEKITFKFKGLNGEFSAEIVQNHGSNSKLLKITLETGTTDDYSFIKQFCEQIHDQQKSPISQIYARTMRTSNNSHMNGYTETFIPPARK